MPFSLDKVVPWGRSYDEYVAMFALSRSDLDRRIVGCADGPASFNAVHAARGGKVVSVDPLYRFTADQIRQRIAATCEEILLQTRRNMHEFVWDRIGSVDELRRLRTSAMDQFLLDFPAGLPEGRYVEGELPDLPFAAGRFDLALCSHFLFLYSEQFSADWHLRAIVEMCRVAAEARVFPLLELGARPSRHLQPVIADLTARGFRAAVTKVDYEFQKGGNEMLVVTRP